MTISILVSDPIFWSTRTMTKSMSNFDYNHQINADGGYANATISGTLSEREINDWIRYGLGRHVEVYSPSLVKIWEGFVNEFSINFGPLSLTRGPLTEITNRATVKYSDFSVGQAARTTAGNATDSQSLYGIIHKVISVGSVSATTAGSIRDVYLGENKWPASGSTISLSGGDVTITINCLGYIEWFNLYPYNEATDTTYTLREKVLEIIGDNPNAIFSTDYGSIEANSLSVFRKDNDDRIALSIIKELVAMGGSSDNTRRMFGVYNDRTCVLQPISTTVDYTLMLGEAGINVRTIGGATVPPWAILPGKWLQVLDFLPGLSQSDNLREDPRMIFIESVTYTSPYDFSINGGKTNTLPQQLAKLGLGGI